MWRHQESLYNLALLRHRQHRKTIDDNRSTSGCHSVASTHSLSLSEGPSCFSVPSPSRSVVTTTIFQSAAAAASEYQKSVAPVNEHPEWWTFAPKDFAISQDSENRTLVIQEDSDDCDDVISTDSLEEIVEFFPRREPSEKMQISAREREDVDWEKSSCRDDFVPIASSDHPSLPKKIYVPYPDEDYPSECSMETGTTTTVTTCVTTSNNRTNTNGNETLCNAVLSSETNQLKTALGGILSRMNQMRKQLKEESRKQKIAAVEGKAKQTTLPDREKASQTSKFMALRQSNSSNIFRLLSKSTPSNDRQVPCQCCISNLRKIQQQQLELTQMKALVKSLVDMIAEKTCNRDSVNSLRSPRGMMKGITEDFNPSLKSGNKPPSVVPKNMEPNTRFLKCDAAAVELTVSTSTAECTKMSLSSKSSFDSSSPLSSQYRPRIASLPLAKVGDDCPRSKKQRIRINGQNGTYSGPTIQNKACTLQGCVVRMDNGELYVGSLSRNDTGTFTFHQPGTLYGRNSSPKRRIR